MNAMDLWTFGDDRADVSTADAPDYEEAKRIAQTGTAEEKAALAASSSLQPELLYFFATDESLEVRQAVAQNGATPLQADVVLAKDADENVRGSLAEKVSKLLPAADSTSNANVANLVHDCLNTLARDQLPAIRSVMSDAIKSLENVPKPIVSMLARDIDEIVASPVLEFSPLLSDAELVEIVVDGLGGGALSAVARREGLGAAVSDAVTTTGDTSAIATLLENHSAEIADKTFDKITDLAETNESLHSGLVGRPELPEESVKRVANFVSAALLERLAERNDLNPAIMSHIQQNLEQQIAGAGGGSTLSRLDDPEAKQLAKDDFAGGRIPQHKIMRHLNDGNLAYVVQAVVLMAGVAEGKVIDAFTKGDGRAIAALAWKCGLDPYLAEVIQEKTPSVTAESIVPPGSNGMFALREDEMSSLVSALQC